jgi:hypothetical protein
MNTKTKPAKTGRKRKYFDDPDSGLPVIGLTRRPDGRWRIQGTHQTFRETPPRFFSGATMSDLLLQMNGLVDWIQTRIECGQKDHWKLCNDAANHSALWDNDDRFPTWLSRIVEGELRDKE